MKKIIYTLILAITFVTSYSQESETELKQTKTQKPIKRIFSRIVIKNHELKTKPTASI